MTWQFLTGVLEYWRDEGRLDLGRYRFHERRGRKDGSLDLLPLGTTELIRAAFIAQRSPWVAVELFMEPRFEERFIVNAWAERPGMVEEAPGLFTTQDPACAGLKGDPARGFVLSDNQSLGDHGLEDLLLPGWLDAVVRPPLRTSFSFAGELLERDMFLVPGLISLAADSYEVEFDTELGIITAFSAFIDGECAKRFRILGVREPPMLRTA